MVRSMNSGTHEKAIFCMNCEGKCYGPSFEPHKCVIFAESTKIGTHENKAIHGMPHGRMGI